MGVLKNIWNSIKGFVKGVATGDWNGDVLGEAVLPDGIGGLPEQIGGLWNDISGATDQNQFIAEREDIKHQREVELANTEIQRRVQDIKDAGLSPSLFYASGGNGASTPSSAGASTGSGSAMDVFGSIGSIMNSINTARELDWKTGIDQMPNRKTSEVYKDLSSIIHTVSKSIGFDG